MTADLIAKIIWLADGGDADANVFRGEVDAARSQGIKPDGVRAMQRIEDELLGEAEKFELIDSIGHRELDRIREDRNLCVHPSLRHLGEVYEPRPEVARGLKGAQTPDPTSSSEFVFVDESAQYVAPANRGPVARPWSRSRLRLRGLEPKTRWGLRRL